MKHHDLAALLDLPGNIFSTLKHFCSTLTCFSTLQRFFFTLEHCFLTLSHSFLTLVHAFSPLDRTLLFHFFFNPVHLGPPDFPAARSASFTLDGSSSSRLPAYKLWAVGGPIWGLQWSGWVLEAT